jgi:hypothetical protein
MREANVALPVAVGVEMQQMAKGGNLGAPRRTQEMHMAEETPDMKPLDQIAGLSLAIAKDESPLMGPSTVDLFDSKVICNSWLIYDLGLYRKFIFIGFPSSRGPH